MLSKIVVKANFDYCLISINCSQEFKNFKQKMKMLSPRTEFTPEY